jgi:hypothetical protein
MRARISAGATAQPVRKPGATVFEKVERYRTRPSSSKDLIGGRWSPR